MLIDQDSLDQMWRSVPAASLIAFGFLFSCASVARSDEWVTCKRDSSTGQFLWLRGKSTELIENVEYRPGPVSPDLGTCLVGNDQLRKAHGLKF